ncbi:mitochondrial ribosome-associated GTPase 1-like [Uloborus diversus]|uniref:mitochondrial ribosome-associated GTPase 1-like n=1 Tax=Uloborus diversus TaxID=327109 RepID=UPI00240A920D|nr:mitochondrial ribosome-associated GTPase 1-like [Uloborus diversus]
MLSAIKPHILVLNKTDLADLTQKEKIKKHLLKESVKEVLFTDCKASSKTGVEKILPTAIELMKDGDFHNRLNRNSFSLMVIGVPNIGKSSVINKLRNIHLKQGKATSVGAVPGITKSVLEKIKISENPLVYLYDTPGIMTPSIDSFEVGLKLALCRTLNDSLVGLDLMADYLLFWLNKHKKFKYVNYLELNEPLDDIRMVLLHIAKQFNKVQKIKTAEGNLVMMPDITSSAMYFLRGFREGHYGKILLDCDHLNKIS